MNELKHETTFESSPLGINLSFNTTPGGYYPSHWHEEMEILYPLNGEADITVDNKTYRLPKKNITVIECCKVHSTHAHNDAMYLRISMSKECLLNYMPDIVDCQIQCIPETIREELFPEYCKICDLLAELTTMYMHDASAFRLEAEGLILQVIARLLRFFSFHSIPDISSLSDTLAIERIRNVIRFVEQHFQENISSQDAAAFLGISQEHFCRIFKKNTGTSFLQYLDEVRLSKIYSDLQSTSLPVAEIMEKNGFTNQKRFNLSFKKMYGCTPSSIRKP